VPNGLWPSEFDGAYIYGDYVCGKLFLLTQNSSGAYVSAPFFTGLGRGTPIHVQFGPANGTQALYYTSRGNNQIRRIVFVGDGNRTPSASFSATPSFGQPPLLVSFDASASSDPDGDALSYSWDFGDGASGSGVTTQHTYTRSGAFTATLTVSDGSAQATFDTRIDVGNAPPVPVIEPLSGTTYAVGQALSLRASATDPDGDPVSFEWEVIIYHNEHTHPYVSDVYTPVATFNAPAPEDLAATERSYLEVRLIATDAKGLAATTTMTLQPRKVNVSFDSDPPGVTLQVNDSTVTTPATLVSWENYVLQVTAPSTATIGGAQHTFQSWGDGGSAQRTIVTSASGGLFRVNYTLVPGENPPPVRYRVWLPLLRQIGVATGAAKVDAAEPHPAWTPFCRLS
jgi:PKD repeat protein